MSTLLLEKLAAYSDHGAKPAVINIEKETLSNKNYRTVLWTGDNLQLTVMCIKPGEDIGFEKHSEVDQFLRIESGSGFVKMGKEQNNLNYVKRVKTGDAILVPSGVWHNLINSGRTELKLYSIYSPVEHKQGTIHKTKSDAEKDE